MIIKTCLCQKYNDKWHLVMYFSKKLTSAEQNYEIHDKRLLIIVTVLKTWKIYAKKTSKFIILINHKNFLYFIITKKLNQKQIKWSKKFEQYKFTIRYTSNKNNDRANALNRQQNYKKKNQIQHFKNQQRRINFSQYAETECNITNIQKRSKTVFKNEKKNWSYQKTKWMSLLKNIMTNHCKIISIYSKQCNFYDSIVDSTICDRKSKHTSKNVLIVKKTNTVFTKNTKKFNIKCRRTNHETKWRWIS